MLRSNWAKYTQWKGLLLVSVCTAIGTLVGGRVDLYNGCAFLVMALCVVYIWSTESE